MSDPGQAPPPHELQFQHAEVLPAEGASGPTSQFCVACKRPIGGTFYHAQGRMVCPECASRIQAGQQAPPRLWLARALLYGAGAALGGCILYAAVAIITGWEFGLVAIVVGYMVGKAIRHGSRGLGGRPQQVLAVVLTYFAITTSYIPVLVYETAHHPEQFARSRKAQGGAAQSGAVPGGTAQSGTAQSGTAGSRPPAAPGSPRQPHMTFAAAIVMLLLLTAAAPFFGLASGFSGIITLFLIFIGIRQAWKLTGRSEILVTGPYETAPVS
jgi:hypothetical protein